VERARTGDKAAFAVLYQQRAGGVLRYAMSLLRNPAAAEDVAAQTFLQAWQGLPRLKHADRFDAWLFRIAHNVAMSELRRQPTAPLETAPEIAGILVAQAVDVEGTQGGGFAFSPDGGETVINSDSSSLVAHLDAKGKAEGMAGFDLTRPGVLASFRYDGAGGISLELRVVIPATSATYGVIARRRVAG